MSDSASPKCGSEWHGHSAVCPECNETPRQILGREIARLRNGLGAAIRARDEARARADAAEAETVRRIAGWLCRERRYDNPLIELDLAGSIERGDWKGDTAMAREVPGPKVDEGGGDGDCG